MFKRFRNSCYFVNELGDVKTHDRVIEFYSNGFLVQREIKGRILKPQLDRYGYLYYRLRDVFKSKNVKAHRMVAECFLGGYSNE